MKKLLLFTFLSVSLFAQPGKRRTVVFDADTTTKADAGFYGIGIRDSQPYLVRPSGPAMMFDVHPTKIKGYQFNANGTAPRDVSIITINKDSLTIDLPNASDTINKNLFYQIMYFGFDKKNQFKVADTTYLVSFADTIFAYVDANKTTYWTKTFSHLATRSFFKIEPYTSKYIFVYNNKWYLRSKEFEF